MSYILVLALAAIVMTSQWSPVLSHGRLMTPPARGSMWRRGFNTPINYNDNQMFCGGLNHQKTLGYKCGLCGDPYDSNRPNEAGGKFATGTIAANYTQGQEVELKVDLTANHKGWFEFKICPTNDYKKKATQECLDLYPLQLSDGSGTKLDVSRLGSTMVTIPVKLPKDLNCDYCVLQWRYHCGNNWGGFKDQEEFYGCSDIRIKPITKSEKSNPTPGATTPVTKPAVKDTTPGQAFTTKQPAKVTSDNVESSTELPLRTKIATQPPVTSSRPGTVTIQGASTKRVKPFIPPHLDKPKIFENIKPQLTRRCKAAMSVPGLDDWCASNCRKGTCPASHCKCEDVLALPTPTTTRVVKDTTPDQAFTTKQPAKITSDIFRPSTKLPVKTQMTTQKLMTSPKTGTKQRIATQPPVTSSRPGTVPTQEASTKRVKPFIPPHLDKPEIFNNIKPQLTKRCKATVTVPGLDDWCASNCPKGTCPASHCKCEEVLALPTSAATPTVKDTTPGQAFTTKQPAKITAEMFKSSTKLPVRTRITTQHPVTSPTTGANQGATTKRVKPFIPPHLDKPKIFNNIKPHVTKRCKATVNVPGLDNWCDYSCRKGACPASHCKCEEVLALPSNV